MEKAAAARSLASPVAAKTELWQCPICLDTLVEPMLTTCCGHSFCAACLDAALRRVDACPLCRSPLLSGPHAMARNRALDELLTRLKTTVGDDGNTLVADHDDDDERAILQTIRDKPHSRSTATPRIVRWTSAVQHRLSQLRASTSRLTTCSVRLQQWRHWLRIHGATLQCVLYVWLFGVFVVFLRVQEEAFAEHDAEAPRRRPRLRTGEGSLGK